MVTSKRVYVKGDLQGLLLPCPYPDCEPLPTHSYTRGPPTLALVQQPVGGRCSFPLGLGVCKLLFVPSKTGVSVSLSPVKSEGESHSVVSNSLRPHGLYSPWNSPSRNSGVGSLSLLQGIFLSQELNQGLLHCRLILYQLSYQGSPSPVESYNQIPLVFELRFPQDS